MSKQNDRKSQQSQQNLHNWKILVLWSVAAAFTILITLIIYFPAGWLAWALERQTKGQLVLNEVQGSLWEGSAVVATLSESVIEATLNNPLNEVSDNPSEKVQIATPLFPGRFFWELSPSLLWGQITLKIVNPKVITPALMIDGDSATLNISAARLSFPIDTLHALGQPLNTLKLRGEAALSWDTLHFVRQDNQWIVTGNMRAQIQTLTTPLAGVKPLGSYQLEIKFYGQQAAIKLSTLTGTLLLNGSGNFQKQHLQFHGTAQAAPGAEEKLASFLSLLGPSTRQNGQKITELKIR